MSAFGGKADITSRVSDVTADSKPTRVSPLGLRPSGWIDPICYFHYQSRYNLKQKACSMKTILARFLRDEFGTVVIENSLITFLISIGIVGTLTVIGISGALWGRTTDASPNKSGRQVVPTCADEQIRSNKHGSLTLSRLGFSLTAALKTVLQNDNRRVPRRVCDTSAWIRPEGFFKPRECRVLDFSDLGVRLTLVDAHRIPDRLTVFLTKNSAGRKARVKWRHGTQIGAEYSWAFHHERCRVN
jgi:Flp pilus assembly pilin Flp